MENIGRIILISELILVIIFITIRLVYSIKSDVEMNKGRRQEYINNKKRRKPEMRDVILKR